MARKGSIESNDFKKRLAKRFADKRAKMKSVVMDKSASIEERFNMALRLAKLPRNSSRVRVRSRCVLSGRPRAVYRFCNLSRIAFRDLATSGRLPGVKRSSW
ncbi:30S ribosomal protein S14 [Candidatus Hydrogenosomobacter endosymbioticus]|nr:30S ribosomal protein S14 [Candidatus Hydrogenosomobacter endosymbioticus]